MADVQKFLQQIADRRAGKIPNTKYATQRDYKTNMAASYEREKRILQHKQGVNTDNSDTSSEIKQLDVIYDDSGKVTGFKEKNQNNNRLSGSALPLAGEQMLNAQERALNKRKNNPDTVPTYEQYLMRLADTYNTQTVPSREQAQQYNADSKMLFEGEMQEKYANADYEALMSAADKTEKYQEKQWLKSKAEEAATSTDLQKRMDNLTKEYEDLYNAGTDIEKDKRRDEIEKELEELDYKIKDKTKEETRKEALDIINNNDDIKSVLDVLYKANNSKYTGSNADEAVALYEQDYTSIVSDSEKEDAKRKYEKLIEKGYDMDALYKEYERSLNEDRSASQIEQQSEYAKENPIPATFNSIITSAFMSPLDVAKSVGSAVGDGYLDTNTLYSKQAGAMQSAVAETLDNPIEKTIYSAVSSIVENLLLLPVTISTGGVGEAITFGIYGAQGAASGIADTYDNTGDIGKSLATGIAQGVAEGLFEEWSLDKYKGIKSIMESGSVTFGDVLKKIGVSAFVEGDEELNTSLVNAITDQIINGDKSKLMVAYNNYISQGMTEQQASAQSAKDFFIQLFQDFVGGAIAGCFLSSGTAISSYVSNSKNARQIGESAMDSEEFDIDALIDSALKTDKNSKAYKMGQSMMRAKNSGNSKSLFEPVNVGNLIKLTTAEYKKNGKAIQNNSKQQEQSKSTASKKNTEQQKQDTSAQPVKQEKAQTSADIKEWARKKYKFNSEEEKEEFLKILSPFGTKNEKGLVANIYENGKKKLVMVDGIESSSRYYEDANNQITLRLTDGTVMSADDVMFHDNKFQQLVKNAAAFDTMGAQAYVRAYEDYENYAGSKADMTRYSEDFDTMYDVGRAGITYDTFLKSGQYKAIYRSIGEKAARQAIFAGNLDGDYRYRDPKNKMLKVRGVKGNVVVQEGVSFDREKNSEIISLLGSLSEKVGRDVVITNSFDNTNIKGQFNPRTGKLYVSADINTAEMLSIALHEAGHSIKLSAPEEWRELEKFVVNYLTSQNKNVSQMIDEQMEIYRASGQILDKETALEEIVCNSLMSLASDEKALQTAIKSTDKKALKKIADAIRKIAAKIKSWLSGRNAISAEAYRPFMNDIDALMKLAEKFEKAAESGKGVEIKQNGGEKYSFAGEKALTANASLLNKAKEMERSGKNYEAIRKETGWFRGYDGKWRFEIDDSDIKISNHPIYSNNPKVKRLEELSNKLLYGDDMSDDERQEFIQLSDDKEAKPKYLYEFVKHDKLFKAYPQLKDMGIAFINLSKYGNTANINGYYDRYWNEIVIKNTLRLQPKQLKKTLIHEIQHAIQDIENHSNGANQNYWEKQIENAQSEYEKINTQYERRFDGLIDVLYRYGFTDKDFETTDITTEEGIYKAKKYLEKKAPKGAAEMADLLIDTMKDRNAAFSNALHLKNRSASELYEATSGEIEARDTANRVEYNSEQRKNTRPDIDRKDVVFAEGGISYFAKNNKVTKEDQLTIKEQIKAHLSQLNNMESVVTINSKGRDNRNDSKIKEEVSAEYKKIGNGVDRQNFGFIELLKDEVSVALTYLKSDAEIAAFAAVPKVLKRGIEIDHHKSHKDRGYDSWTFSAPVTINGKKGFVGVVVRKTGKYRYKTHRIVATDGSEFILIKEDAEAKNLGFTTKTNDSKGSNITSASKEIITQKGKDVKHSVDDAGTSKIKYAIDDIIDNNRDLVAIHNLSAKNLIKMISEFDGKGIPAPSIAIDKADNVHSDFGEISLIFDRNTIDPKADRRNSVYSRDAWTSMYPKTEFKLNEKEMKKLAERLDMSVNELKSNMFDTSDIQKIKYRFEDDVKVRKAFLKENNIKVTPALHDRQPDIMMFSARAVKKFVRKNDCTFDKLVNDKEFRNELFKSYLDGASLKGIAKAHIEETDENLDLAKSKEFYSVLKEKFDYAIEYANGNIQQTEGSMYEAVNNAIEEYKAEFSSYIDGLLSSGVLGEEYIVRDDVDPYDEDGNRKPFSKTHYKYNIENVVQAMKSGRSKVGSSFTGGVSYVKSIGAKKLNSIEEIKGNEHKIVSMTDEELEAENERISELIKPLIEEVADSGEYNNDFITASNNIVDAFNSKNDVKGVYDYLKKYHNKIKMSTVKKLFAAKAEIENLPTRYFEAKPHRAVSFDEVKAAVIPSDTDNTVKEALRQLGVPMYEYDSNNENSRAEVTQKAINTEYIDINGEKHSDLRFAIDDEYGMFDDLLEGETEEQKAERWHEEFEKYLQYNPEQALLMTYNAGAKTAEQAIKVYDTALDEKRVDRAIRKVWEQYHISANSEKLAFSDFKKALNEYVADVREGKISYGESFENLVMACRDSLQLSALEDHNYDGFRAELKAVCKNGLVLNKYEESEIKEIYGSVARYRNALFGKCTVRLERNINSAGGKKTGQYIDDIIADLSNKFGDMVPADMHSLEGLQWFEQLVNKYWQPQYINPYIDGYSEDINTAAIQMAYDMSSAYIAEMSKQIVSNSKADKRQLREVTRLARQTKQESQQLARAKEKAVKDKYEKQIADNKKRYDKSINRLSENLKNERMKGLKRAADTERQLNKLRKQRDQLEAQNKRQRVIINEGFAPIRDQYLEKKRATILRNRLGRMLNSLSKRLDGKANNNEYIPESLKQPILDVLSSFAVDPGKTKYGKQKAVPGYYGEYRRINEIGNAVTRLAQKYSAIDKSKSDNKGKSENQDYAFIDIESLAYKEKTQKALSKLSDQLEGKNIYQLDVYDLEEVVDTMELLDQTLKDAVSVIIDGQKQQITEAATKAVEEIKSVKFSKDVQKFGNSMVNNILSTPRELRNAYVATHLDPVRYGKFLSGYHEDSVTYKIFSDLHEGDKKRIRILESAMLEVQRTLAEYDDKEIKALQKNDVAEFDLRDIESGKRVKITQGVLLAIYLTDRQADGHRHMVNDQWNSYIVVPDVDYMNSPITELKGKNSSGDKFHKIRLTQSDIEHINKYVEENRLLKDLAKSISYVYNEMLPEEINAVSMAKYGKRIATVENYYPLKVYKDGAKFSDKNFEAEFNDIRMKSRGFTKQREFSYASIMIDDVLRTFQRHVGSVSEWCGLLIPIENFKKVYNSGNGMNTMHEAIKKKFGPSAEHYIDKLMGDLQNQRDSVDDNVLVKVQQKYMGAVLMLNPGAAVKQMAAFPLANKYFGHINVAKSTVMGAVKGKELCEIYSKYTPYLWYRAQGNGTIVGETSRQAGFYGKATDALDIMGKMDRYVVNSMLYAAEQHIKKTTDLKPGTEEFYKEVARQYEKFVDESQPNNMITSKPQFVRNNVLKTLSMNAFMSQTMAMGNGLIDSFMEWRARAYDYQVNNKSAESKAAKNEAGKRFLQHCIGVLESAALLSVLSLISVFGYHKWDDFKDENGNVTFDKIKKNMIDYFLDGALGSFAWGKQMYEFIASWATGETYYGLEVMSISNINDIAKDIQKGNFMSLATMVGDCIGLPASNAYRIARSVSAYVNDMMYGNGNIIISNSGFNDVNLDNLPSMIVTALQSGDRDKAEYYENMLKEHLINDNGKSEKEAVDSIKNKIVSILADGDEVGEIAKLKYNGELQEYENRVNKLVAQGFDSVDVKKAVDKAVSNVKADMRENDITDNESATDWLINQGFNEQAAQRISEDYLSYIDDESEEVAGALEDSSENDESTKYAYDDLWNALISGNDDLYNEIYENITTADGKLTDKKDIEKKQKAADSSMKSTSRTDKLWAEYVEAVRGSDPARVKELRNIFIRIYGSWDKALEALKRYKERQKQNQ